ncbi:MAG: DNA mismatch repair endonuclease MutL [Endomicrobium sp.]|jgi:DNA mismatch repair protein MutL|uniref:DNA mismatch repair endonuclease MutL n=1 Tax=Candidatus Endomicrobiellum cubanum TaxID=3242325 RepID=UPI00282AD525|nr:DNA mismatch repair endonuclease MutL [Endomicrobium sp.]
MSINILSQETINKIAAGEVVERPLSVVKELVDNSLDALSSSIIVEIEQSGKKLIRVQDDGVGMDKSDLELSIVRHATSKIANFNDLFYINSFGFRGEALASIAAISNLEIKTRRRGDISGWKLTTKGGKDVEILPSSLSEGTITEVKDLFFNVPVRYKFLKSDFTERTKILSTLEEIALANREVSFKVISENRVIFSALKTDKTINRISDILGENFANKLQNVNADFDTVYISIYFTNRDNALQNKKHQYLFINSRSVNFPKWLMHCINLSYRESIPHDKYPGILIYININPSEIDVNISTTKREVKFANEKAMYDIIYKILKDSLVSQSYSSIPNMNLTNNENHENMNLEVSRTNINANENKNILNPSYVREPKIEYGKFSFSKQNYNIGKYVNVFARQESFSINDKFDENIKVLGQVFNTYVIVENQENLYIFDQHAAAERVKYELYVSQINNNSIKQQALLMPENISCSKSEAEIIKANISLFKEIGIDIDEFGDNFFRITAYPALLGDMQIEPIVKNVILDVEDLKNIEISQKRDKIIRFACSASIKAGDNISLIEIKKLVSDLFKCKYPFTCPHGRPTAYKISLNDLEKFFKRK